MDEPQYGDYTLTPCGPLGGRVAVSDGRYFQTYLETEDALGAIRSRMESERCWPAVWWVSDHGNCWQIDLDGNEVT